MILTVSNEKLLQYLLNNATFVGFPRGLVRGQMFTFLNIIDQPIPTPEQMHFIVTVTEGEIFTMPTLEGYTYDYSINWGDGVEETITSETASHQFVAAGTYSVLIGGLCPTFSFDNTGTSKDMLVEVESLGNLALNALAFSGCVNLHTFNSGVLVDTSAMISVRSLFDSCTSLTQSTLNLDLTACTDLYRMFASCQLLVSIDLSDITFGTILTGQEIFNNCNALANLNFDLSLLNSLQNYNYIFLNCSSLTSIDSANMVGANATSLVSTFQSCSSLGTVDFTGWNIGSITNVQGCFNGCPIITDAAPEWWNIETITIFENCFTGNTLRPNYVFIPVTWIGQTQGANVINNPDFIDSSNWVLQLGWTISGGELHHDGTNTGSSTYQDDPPPLIDAHFYEGVIKINGISGTGLNIELNGTTVSVLAVDNGFYRFNFYKAANADKAIYLSNRDNWAGSIEYFYVYDQGL